MAGFLFCVSNSSGKVFSFEEDKLCVHQGISDTKYSFPKMPVAHVYGQHWLMELTAAKACRETGGIGKDKPEIILHFL